jgi:glucoamylase
MARASSRPAAAATSSWPDCCARRARSRGMPSAPLRSRDASIHFLAYQPGIKGSPVRRRMTRAPDENSKNSRPAQCRHKKTAFECQRSQIKPQPRQDGSSGQTDHRRPLRHKRGLMQYTTSIYSQLRGVQPRLFALGLLSFSLYFAHPNESMAGNPGLDSKIQSMLERSLPRLACNLSSGSPGSVIASPQTDDPNYYFHWIRDSAVVVQSLSRLLPHIRHTTNEARIRDFIEEFVTFSDRLQRASTPYGLGEMRFNADGSIDQSSWPRPQFDGPALRALALLDYLERDGSNLGLTAVGRIDSVVRTDLDAVAKHYNEKGFDLWEYASGFHFYTRMVQKGALLKGQGYFKHLSDPQWMRAANELTSQLERHWHPRFGTIGEDLSDGLARDSDGNPIDDDESAFSTSAVLAVNHAALSGQAFDNLDTRVWSSLWKQQEYFLRNFPFNANKKLGPGIGRGPDDGYYGGNAFFFLTAAFAEHDFHIASRLARENGVLVADNERLPTLRQVLQSRVKRGARFPLPNRALADAFAGEGDAFLETMLGVIPADGTMAEQFSKEDGSPVSAKDLSWSYASVLTAVLQREDWSSSTVDYSRIDFRCPEPEEITSAR